MECIICKEEFVHVDHGRGYKKHLVSKADLTFRDETLMAIIGSNTMQTPSKKKHVCPVCYSFIKKIHKLEESVKQFRARIGVPGTPQHHKRRLSPSKTPRRIKRPRITTSVHKSGGMKKSHRVISGYSLKRAINNLYQSQYTRAFMHLFNGTKACKNALVNMLGSHLFNDISKLLKTPDFPLAAVANLDNMETFKWRSVVNTVKEKAPFLTSMLTAMMCSVKSQIGNIDLVLGENETSFGMILSVILFRRNRKLRFFQSVNSLQLWTSGCKSEVISRFNKIGLCLSTTATLRAVDTIRRSFDRDMLHTKEIIETLMNLQTEIADDPDVCSTSCSQGKKLARELFPLLDENTEHLHLEETGCHPGFTMCWDNIGRKTTARHQSKVRTNVMHLWALAYAADNRVPTLHLTDSEVKDATYIPLQEFHHSERDMEELKRDLKFCVAEVLCNYVEFFRNNMSEACWRLNSMHHEHSSEMETKSKIYNLGVIQQNPASVSGTISILEHLQSYVPYKGKVPLQTVVYGDALSCERHNDAHYARVNCDPPSARLEGVEPSPQEFHKRMLLLQDTMDEFFTGKSASDRGSLYHMKNIFGHHSVKADVTKSFNHVVDLLSVATDCYCVLLAKELTKMDSLSDIPYNFDMELILDAKYCDKYLSDTCDNLVQTFWQESPVVNLNLAERDVAVYADEFNYCLCKEELADTEMVKCGNADCDRGQWFHFECVGVTQEKVDELGDDDWFCSEQCKVPSVYEFCCGVDKGDIPMIACDNAKCTKKWFHFECVGISDDDIPTGKWFCSVCTGSGKRRKSKGKQGEAGKTQKDDIRDYCLALLWRGMNDRVRHKAVRYGNGPKMVMYWRIDMTEFLNRKHHKYFLLGHRLLAGINGWLPERVRTDIVWNRVVNYTGGSEKNLEMDLVNEYLNREFITDMKQKSSMTEATVERHGALVGRVKKCLGKVFNEIVGEESVGHIGGKFHCQETVLEMVKMYSKEGLFVFKSGRKMRGLPNFQYSLVSDEKQFAGRLQKLSKRLDRRRKLLS